jgi:hypothetical protein
MTRSEVAGDAVKGGMRGYLYIWSSTCREIVIKLLEEVWCIEFFVIYPQVVSVGVLFPMHKILQHLLPAISSHIEDSIDLILFFFFYDRWWMHVWFSICFHYLVRREEVDMKDVMNFHHWWKL